MGKFPLMTILGQQAPAAEMHWLSLDTIFWATVLLIFLVTVLTAFLRRLTKDKALKLIHEYHVTFFSERRLTVWGDLLVSSQGVELLFDQSYTTRRQVVKSSALLYDDEFTPFCMFTRSIHGLTEQERKDRERQIERTFNPHVFRRMRRWFRNMLNTFRDAISKTMNLVIGRFTGGAAAQAMAAQAGDINSLTGSIVSLAANAYEPLLERYIGKPVAVEIALPPPPGPPPPPNWIPEVVEFPGYLVDYTQRFVAVFNVDHTPVETIEIRLEPGKAPTPDLADLKVTVSPDHLMIECKGKDAFVLRKICCEAHDSDLGIAMIPGTSLLLAPVDRPYVLTVERTRRIDMVIPRTRARVRFGAMPVDRTGRRRSTWLGIAPVMEPREILHSLKENVHTLRSHLRETLPFGGSRSDGDPPEKPRS